MNIYSKLYDLNYASLGNLIKRESTVALLLESSSCDKSKIPILVDVLPSNFYYIKESLLAYLYHLRYFYNKHNDQYTEQFMSCVNNTLKLSYRKNSYVKSSSDSLLPELSLGEIINSSNYGPFSITENEVDDISDFRRLIKLFGHGFIHRHILSTLKENPDTEVDIANSDDEIETDSIFEFVLDNLYDLLAFGQLFLETNSYIPNLNTLEQSNEDIFLEFTLCSDISIEYITLSSKELTSYINRNLTNQYNLDKLISHFYYLLPYCVANIISLSTPIIIDKTSPFHNKCEDFNLLFAVVVDTREDSEYISYSSSTLKEVGRLLEEAFKSSN